MAVVKHHDQIATWRGKTLFQLIVPSPSPPLREVRTGTWRQELMNAMKESCLLALAQVSPPTMSCVFSHQSNKMHHRPIWSVHLKIFFPRKTLNFGHVDMKLVSTSGVHFPGTILKGGNQLLKVVLWSLSGQMSYYCTTALWLLSCGAQVTTRHLHLAVAVSVLRHIFPAPQRFVFEKVQVSVWKLVDKALGLKVPL